MHRGQSACAMIVRMAVSHSLEWRGGADLDSGPPSPTGCEAGFHGSVFDLLLQSAEGSKLLLFFWMLHKTSSRAVPLP